MEKPNEQRELTEAELMGILRVKFGSEKSRILETYNVVTKQLTEKEDAVEKLQGEIKVLRRDKTAIDNWIACQDWVTGNIGTWKSELLASEEKERAKTDQIKAAREAKEAKEKKEAMEAEKKASEKPVNT